MTEQTETYMHDYQETPDHSTEREISPFDADAEPDDLASMELALSETTEDDTKLTGEEQDECCGWPPKDEDGCCDMPLEEYDPGMLEDNIEQMMEDLALAEPEPPEETCPVPASSEAGEVSDEQP